VDSDSVSAKTSGTVVRFSDRTWYTEPGYGDAIVASPFPSREKIKDDLASGNMEIVGTGEVVNGQTTIHLRKTKDTVVTKDANAMPGISEAVFTDLWVNESTYLPIRIDRDDYSWLPPTPENLALLKPTIPEGFTQVPSPGR